MGLLLLRVLSRLVGSTVALAFVLTIGCGGEDNRGFGAADSSIPVKELLEEQGMVGSTTLPEEPYSCITGPTQSRKLQEVSGLLPQGYRPEPRPHEIDWIPGLVIDMDLGASLIVADALGPGIYEVSRDLREHTRVVGEGRGPGEVIRPKAVAIDTSRSRFVVVDEGSGRLKSFDLKGHVRETWRLSGFVSDVAVGSDGTVFIGHVVGTIPGSRKTGNTVVSVARPDQGEIEPLVTLDRDDLGPPRVVLPGPNEVGLRVTDDRLIVWYPASGSVDVFTLSGTPLYYTRVCVPASVDEFYRRQRESLTTAASSLKLLTDVMATEAGGLAAVSALEVESEGYHVDFFDDEGHPIGSWVSGPTPIRMPPEVRFGASPLELWAFDYGGLIAHLRFE